MHQNIFDTYHLCCILKLSINLFVHYKDLDISIILIRIGTRNN